MLCFIFAFYFQKAWTQRDRKRSPKIRIKQWGLRSLPNSCFLSPLPAALHHHHNRSLLTPKKFRVRQIIISFHLSAKQFVFTVISVQCHCLTCGIKYLFDIHQQPICDSSFEGHCYKTAVLTKAVVAPITHDYILLPTQPIKKKPLHWTVVNFQRKKYKK